MKILITESQLKVLNELSGAFKDETEIIYRDNNIVCLIPKTQMSSKMYGKDAHWCQVDQAGFYYWSKSALLIRFLFRGGRKIRFSYFIKPYNSDGTENDSDFSFATGQFYWANENGAHVLKGNGNPFFPKTKSDRIRETEMDILNKIKEIPEECKNKVLDFIKQHQDSYDYCYRKEEFFTRKEKAYKDKVKNLINVVEKYEKSLYKLRYSDIFIMPNIERVEGYYIKYQFSRDSEMVKEKFNDSFTLENRLKELIKIGKQKLKESPTLVQRT